VIAIDIALDKKKVGFRVPVMAFAVGVYLPFHLSTPILLGGVIAMLVNRTLTKTNANAERRGMVERMGLLAAAGFITGEALMGIGLAVPIAAKHDENAIAMVLEYPNGPDKPGVAAYQNLWMPSLVIVAIVLVLLYKLSFKRETVAK
jgi:hypothetical protein